MSAIIGLAILVLVRARAKVTAIIWWISIIGYVIWIYAIGNGPLQALAEAISLTLPAAVGGFAVVVYSAVVGVLTFNPPKAS